MDNDNRINADYQTSGFIGGLSNIFSGVGDIAKDLTGIYDGWSDVQAKKDAQEASLKERELNQNLDITVAESNAASEAAKQKIVTYGVVGALSLTAVYLAYRILK